MVRQAANPRFHVLSPPISDTKMAEEEPGSFELIECPIHPGHRRGKRAEKLRVVIDSPLVSDFVWVWGGPVLVQERVVEAFADARLTGWQVRQVTARFAGVSDRPPSLFELVVIGWGGVAPESSG